MRGLGLGLGLGLGGSGAGIFNPASIPNLALYLMADPANITLNGSNVSQWSDISGNGHHFTQATGARQPPFNSSGVNGKGAVVGDGATLLFLQCIHTMSGIMGSATAGERFILAQMTADGNGFAWGINWGTGDNGSFFKFTDTKCYDGFGTTTRQTGNAVGAGLVTSPFVQDVQSGASAFSIAYNGTTNFTSGTNTISWPASFPTVISSATTSCPVKIRAVLAYSRILNTTERAQVMAWLPTA